MQNELKDIIILGAGVSGLFLGYLLKNNTKKSFLLLEHNDKAGKKLSLAGGGMGNLTNKSVSIENYIGQDTTFAESTLKSFNSKKAINLFKTLNIPLEEREYGQIFSLKPASELVSILTSQLPIEYNTEILKVTHEENCFLISTSNRNYRAKNLVIATGSSAYPQIGASQLGIQIAKSFNIRTLPFTPVLTPVLLPKNSSLCELAGITINVGIQIKDKKLIRPLLFTHTGMSGPAILIQSCFFAENKEFVLDFLPEINSIELLHAKENGKLLVKNLLAKYLPNRLVHALIPEQLSDKKVAELSKKERLEISSAFNTHCFKEFTIAPLEKAEAARGGICTFELNPQTLESIKIPALYFSGEVIDITGLLGGYNIHWALASAHQIYKSFDI